MTWDRSKPLVGMDGEFLTDATGEEADAVQEELERCHDVYQWVTAIKSGKETKASVYAKFRNGPEVYVNDMVERIKRELKDRAVPRPGTGDRSVKRGFA
jgi:tryptophanyl-tRNA synthetase